MYLIDGNNVIGQRAKGYGSWFRDKVGARQQFLRELARLARVRKLKLAVVFDGAPDAAFPDGASYSGVKVYYARQNSDADTRIVELAEAEKNKKSLQVVTSDGKLAQRVRVCGVKVMRAGEFRKLLDEAEESVPAHEARVHEEDMGQWMRYFGVDDSDDQE